VTTAIRPRQGDAPDDRRRWLELGVLAAILLLAALTRLPGLDARGQWDADQGHDMTVLADLVGHGQLPLLGPATSVGTFHHGALYYYLLAPSALLSGASPVAVTVEFALLGIAAVAATWWLARLVGGPVAALVAGGLLAVSPAGISESTFIWNPNPIALFAALAAIGVIEARRSGRLRWWVLAALGTMATMQLHWLGGVLAVPVAGAWVLELRRVRGAGGDTRVLRRAGLLGTAILALGYLPLAIHEATNDASEIRAVLAYLTGGAGGAQAGIAVRLLMVTVRSLTWPVAGLVTDRPTASAAVLMLVTVLGAVAVLPARRRRAADSDAQPPGDPAGPTVPTGRSAARWLLGALAFSVVALAVLAPSLAVVVPGLPNDHYHAFLDPIVLTLVGAGVAGLVRASLGGGRTPAVRDGGGAADAGNAAPAATRLAGPAVGLVMTAGLVVVAVTAWPPAVSPDGGWRLADAAAAHVIEVVSAGWPPEEPRLLVGLPTFKPDDAMRFPLERRGFGLEPPVTGPAADIGPGVGVVTIVCDPLFDDTTGVACGGPAEERWVADAYPPGTMQLVQRFHAGDRRIMSIYGPSRLAVVP
jgi:4-amino-4-deoxy-L-arabinose transferase-like glycosyltransferase